jgi:hypothetical protein
MFGVTQRITRICDRGSGFTSKRFNEYCNTMGIKVNYTATATPRANVQAERYNMTILNALSASTDDERKWDEAVKSIQWGLNTTSNKTTGKTPYELLLGYRPRHCRVDRLMTPFLVPRCVIRRMMQIFQSLGNRPVNEFVQNRPNKRPDTISVENLPRSTVRGNMC